MSGLFLTTDELTELTGFKQTAGHVRWLERNRWRFALTRSQQPRVARAYFLHRMGLPASHGASAGTSAAEQAAAQEEPDFSALDRF
ncbi:DUF4224 domain-containing protein [uncultured Azohydromonas sp.]|jgi:hypothetical protein|uniref:DUF4224 domain-containing protein n=1 Tax=uncultured Azohydromonas sp. TaxID=487342 RepID=UPI0026209830|nr:DUF4224 domain-containing protein [uncultured Azohydromonas sp.]